MIELVYVSRSQSRLTQQQLLQLLQQCRCNNQRSQISGLLLYDGYGTFIQALEGNEEDVEALFMRIKQDRRHNHIHILGKRKIETKSFADWKMGFRSISSDLISKIDGFSDFLQQAEHHDKNLVDSGFAYQVLDYFRSKSSYETENGQEF